MSDEYSRKPYEKEIGIPVGYTWQDMDSFNELMDTLKKACDFGRIFNNFNR